MDALSTRAERLRPLVPVPSGPAWAVDWPRLEATLPLEPLAACPQEPLHHGEGDVLAHTKLVVESLVADDDWRALDEQSRYELFLASLLHDFGKPATTREEEGRLVSPGHARVGSVIARRLLWEAGVDPRVRERVCALVLHHMQPFFLASRASDDPVEARRRALEISWVAGCERLGLLARADARGRLSETASDFELNAELFQAHCEELGCLKEAYPFASHHSRFLFFLKPSRDPAYEAYDDTRSRVTMLSGLPGAGKDSYVHDHLYGAPVVSLDEIRLEMGIPATDNQGPVVQLARERCREHLRAGRDFVYNATNIARRYRSPFIGLFADYNARVDVVQIEVPASRHDEQNRGRGHEKAVPQDAIERMLRAWEPATLAECHSLKVVGH